MFYFNVVKIVDYMNVSKSLASIKSLHQGGSYVGVWNVAGNPAGVVPVTKENSTDQEEFIVMRRKRKMLRTRIMLRKWIRIFSAGKPR